MIRGLYTGASGMMLQMARQDVAANNIANVNSNGYKKDVTICQAFPDILISRLGDQSTAPNDPGKTLPPVVLGKLGTGAVVADIVTDFSHGSLQATENPTDLALGSDGFFTVRTPAGERFTRDGAFTISPEGYLVTNDGYPVLDLDNQPILLQGEFSVDDKGGIWSQNNLVARLKIAQFADPRYLRKEGGVINPSGQNYTLLQEAGVKQGYLEKSNVNAIQEMVQLINVVRAYESCQKVVQAEDEMTGIAINQVAAIS